MQNIHHRSGWLPTLGLVSISCRWWNVTMRNVVRHYDPVWRRYYRVVSCRLHCVLAILQIWLLNLWMVKEAHFCHCFNVWQSTKNHLVTVASTSSRFLMTFAVRLRETTLWTAVFASCTSHPSQWLGSTRKRCIQRWRLMKSQELDQSGLQQEDRDKRTDDNWRKIIWRKNDENMFPFTKHSHMHPVVVLETLHLTR